MLCSVKVEEGSRLKQCGHFIHGKCLMVHLRDSPRMMTQCRLCQADLRAADIAYVLEKYRLEFQCNRERYNALKWRKYRLFFQSRDEEYLEVSDLRD